jgi:phospholipid/cholesterol/gamma-HCH transport system ATP-binding protein
VRDLTKSFGGKHVLRSVSLVFPTGSTTVVLGASGSGKSVLLKHLIGLLKPDAGQVLVDGEDIVTMGDRALRVVRLKFGMVFQMAALFDSMTVWENVAFPLLEHTKKTHAEVDAIVQEKLHVVGLTGEDRRYPAELSGGMRKRVGLARAMVLAPRIVLWDEPTTGLDPLTTESVNEMIMEAQRHLNATSVVISHDIAAAFAVADQIAVLYKGEFVEVGPPAKVRASEDPYVRHFLDTWFSRN